MKEMLRPLRAGKGKTGFYYSLPALEEKGLGKISRLPASIRIVLESVVRNCRIDTPIEVDYYGHGGILPFVLGQLLSYRN